MPPRLTEALKELADLVLCVSIRSQPGLGSRRGNAQSTQIKYVEAD